MIYTFVTDKEGTTTIEQVEAETLRGAIRKWNDSSMTRPRLQGDRLEDALEPVLLEGLRNAWCIDGIDPDDTFFLVHIVATYEAEAVDRESWWDFPGLEDQ